MGSGKSTKQAHYVSHDVIDERLGKIQLNSVSSAPCAKTPTLLIYMYCYPRIDMLECR